MKNSPEVTIPELQEVGAHFGHRTQKWNPKMAPYIYDERNKIHTIDLRQTKGLFNEALKVIYNTVKNKGKILFVGTKIQASEEIKNCATESGQFYINNRWLGGTLTNWKTISQSIKTLTAKEAELQAQEIEQTLTKREIGGLVKEKDKLIKSLGGIRNLDGYPNLLVIIDTNKEKLAIQEAIKLGIPIVAIVDTNSNPDNITYPIPANDDSIKAINFYCKYFKQAVLNGLWDLLIESGIDIDESVDLASYKLKEEVKDERRPSRDKFGAKSNRFANSRTGSADKPFTRRPKPQQPKPTTTN